MPIAWSVLNICGESDIATPESVADTKPSSVGYTGAAREHKRRFSLQILVDIDQHVRNYFRKIVGPATATRPPPQI
jgi:hypothetical protein